ncbi:unknown [Clostridium sp. CAG:1013]|nr:unknown [Clostridium sp. CAG:1013]
MIEGTAILVMIFGMGSVSIFVLRYSWLFSLAIFFILPFSPIRDSCIYNKYTKFLSGLSIIC